MPTLLYIEDNDANLQLVKLLVARRPDLSMLEATTGRQGIKLALEQNPDIILLDISLPDLTGQEVLQTLKDTPATAATPVIAISGNSAIETRLSAPGFNEYLAKPIDVKALYAAIDEFTSS